MTTDPRRACRGLDTEMWFRDTETGSDAKADTELVLRICRRCPVRLECLTTALAEESGLGRDSRYGIRGGLTGVERYNLVLRRRLREQSAAT